MKHGDILKLRLANQLITNRRSETPAEVVSTLLAIQAQDYAGSKWSIGLRLPGGTEVQVEKAITDRTIIRTWPMRGTLHFVAAEDARWMLKLLTPRIISRTAGRYRQLELNDAIFGKCRDLLVKYMQGGKQLMRNEVYAILESNGIATDGQRGIHVINHLAQLQVLCHGSHNDKQPTYVLFDEWVSVSKELEGEEAIAELALRYFMGHGPATLQDFVWWAGLKISDARKGLEAVATQLCRIDVEGELFWTAPDLLDLPLPKSVQLLPGFDEYMLGYTQRTLMVPEQHLPKIVPGGNGMFMPTLVIDGKVVGLWKRTFQRNGVKVQLFPFGTLNKVNQAKVDHAIRLYGVYLGKEVLN
jgi:hypothetical protein